MLTDNAHAGGLAPKQTPDTNDGTKRHTAVFVLGGAALDITIPKAPLWAKWGLCQVPGLYHEFDGNTPGNRWSRHDLLINAAACLTGIALTSTVRVHVAPQWVGIGWEF